MNQLCSSSDLRELTELLKRLLRVAVLRAAEEGLAWRFGRDGAKPLSWRRFT